MKVLILIGLFFCHFLGDFTYLSNQWMMQAKKHGRPLFPILAHAGVHAILMGVFLGIMGVANVLSLAGIQLISHFAIDLWKGRMNGWFPILRDPDKKISWTFFGFDQFLHAVVIVGMYNLMVI